MAGVSTPPAGFTRVEHSMYLHLKPEFMGNMEAGLKDAMSRLMLRYNEDLEGVPTKYDFLRGLSFEALD